MKKEYESPKAEKMEFNYSETVVASGTGCNFFITLTEVHEGCNMKEVTHWTEQH